jgi:hypothetical protein
VEPRTGFKPAIFYLRVNALDRLSYQAKDTENYLIFHVKYLTKPDARGTYDLASPLRYLARAACASCTRSSTITYYAGKRDNYLAL